MKTTGNVGMTRPSAPTKALYVLSGWVPCVAGKEGGGQEGWGGKHGSKRPTDLGDLNLKDTIRFHTGKIR